MTVPPLKDNGGAACAVRRSSSVVIPRPVDRPVSHGLKRSVEVLIRVSDRVPRPLITEPDLIRCPPTRFPSAKGRRNQGKRNTKEARAYGTESRAFLKPGVRVTRRNSVKARRERERKPNDCSADAEVAHGVLSALFAKIENTELLVGRWRERKREKRQEAFLLSGWWALKNGNPIVSTTHRRSFTADTRKLTLNPKPGVSPLFLYQSTPVLHILPDPFISFPQEYEKGREPSAE
ncbi:hypothetical protein ALC56_00778 [Trachymyrmex septentrionalis]|uniref:Uncharacterized protein n=1 Tax=Trachymyrmex septentrionalis TaxID=34720 RepID=A0A195FWG0_9HYME|nr:hypothetical protein ALC56_00778 [Trachymyrmex septentrionalis]